MCTDKYIKLRRSIAFYVNGNDTCGLGHIYRVLQIANEFTKQSINIDKREFFNKAKHSIVSVEGIEDLLVTSRSEREAIQKKMLVHDLRNGTKRVVECITKLW